jgi:hypothetical protein
MKAARQQLDEIKELEQCCVDCIRVLQGPRWGTLRLYAGSSSQNLNIRGAIFPILLKIAELASVGTTQSEAHMEAATTTDFVVMILLRDRTGHTPSPRLMCSDATLMGSTAHQLISETRPPPRQICEYHLSKRMMIR